MAVVPDVDANGNPETPANQMAEKKKSKNMTVAGLVIGGVGLAVVLYLHNKNSGSSTSNTASNGTAPSGIDPTTGVPYSSELGVSGGAAQGTFSAGETSLMSQLQQYQQQTNAALFGIAEQNQANAVGIENNAIQQADIYSLQKSGPNAPQIKPIPMPMSVPNPFLGSASGATP